MPATLATGVLIHNRYELVHPLGTGAMGAVYLARDRRTGQPVALKQNLSRPNDPDYQAAREQFKREADLLREIRHPHLVRVLDYFETTSTQYLTMEYIPGDDLWSLVQKRPLPFPESQVLEWGLILCDVLNLLHTHIPPIIHRDVKPHNVKLQPDGRIVLVDFGIAKEYRAGQKTRRGAQGLTPGFAPLEQYGQGTDQRTDIYALGATLYCLLTLRVPEDAMERIQKQLPLNLRLWNPNLSVVTAQVIVKAMELKPDLRFQTARDLGHALSQAATASSAPALPATAPQICPVCHTPNRGTARACKACGAPLVTTGRFPCPHCGSVNRAGALRCQQCGRQLAAPGPIPLAPSHPAPLQPALPRAAPASGQCPSCGASNPPAETFCQNCGFELQVIVPKRPAMPGVSSPPRPAPASVSAPPRHAAPSVPPVATPLPVPASPAASLRTRKMVGWIFLAVGALAVSIAVWQSLVGLPLPLTLPLALLGLYSAMAARDLLDRSNLSRANRGRQWSTLAAVLWMMVGCATAWLGVPLVLVVVMLFVLNRLLNPALVQSVGGHYSREGPLTLIGWLLAFTGIGTIPGIALLIPKPWAKQWAAYVLGLILLLALGGVILALSSLTAIDPPYPLDATLPGSDLRPLALSLLTSSLALATGTVAALRYLATVRLNLTATAMRRELNVAAWTCFGAGGAVLGVAWWWWSTLPWGGSAFWLGAAIGMLLILSGADLLHLGARWFTRAPSLAGNDERGRRLGIAGATGLAVVSAALAWQIYPLVLLMTAIFVLRILTGAQAILICGGKPTRPPGLALLTALLVPSVIGTVPGLLMLNAQVRGWQLARWALGALALGGLALAVWAGSYGIAGPANTSWLTATVDIPFGVPVPFAAWTLLTAGVALTISTLVALNYMRSPAVRNYFGV